MLTLWQDHQGTERPGGRQLLVPLDAIYVHELIIWYVTRLPD